MSYNRFIHDVYLNKIPDNLEEICSPKKYDF